jgi:hypothetical protein
VTDQRRIAVEPVAGDDADVVARIEHVERPVGDGQLHAQFGVAVPETADERRQRERRQQTRRDDAQRAGRLAHRVRDGRLEMIELLEQRTAAVEVAQPGFGQRQVARGAVDQPRVQMGLEHRDRTRDECIGHA